MFMLMKIILVMHVNGKIKEIPCIEISSLIPNVKFFKIRN